MRCRHGSARHVSGSGAEGVWAPWSCWPRWEAAACRRLAPEPWRQPALASDLRVQGSRSEYQEPMGGEWKQDPRKSEEAEPGSGGYGGKLGPGGRSPHSAQAAPRARATSGAHARLEAQRSCSGVTGSPTGRGPIACPCVRALGVSGRRAGRAMQQLEGAPTPEPPVTASKQQVDRATQTTLVPTDAQNVLTDGRH